MSVSNQEFSNETTRYSDQITTYTYNGLFQPSNTPITINMNFRKNGDVVTWRITSNTQIAIPNTDNYIAIDTGTIPIEFVPRIRTSIYIFMNMGGAFITNRVKCTILENGNLVITTNNSTYPDNGVLVGQPAFGVTVMGAVYGTYTYTLT